MPEVQITFEETSPILSFSREWNPGSLRDPDRDLYSEGLFMGTDKADSTMSFSFHGSEVAIFGALRDNHGRYQVKVDDNPPVSRDGKSTTGQYQTEIFRGTFPEGPHNLTLTNLQDQWLDVDFVTVRTHLGGSGVGSRFNLLTVQDTVLQGENRFSYSASEWSELPGTHNSFFGGTGHKTNIPNAVATINFKVRHGIAVYGPAGKSYASAYAVSLNGKPEEVFPNPRDHERTQQVLYMAFGLDGGPQELKISFRGRGDEILAIDFANIYRAPNASSSDLQSTIAGTGRIGPHPGIIFGITFSTVVAFLLLATLLTIYLHKRFKFFPFLSTFTIFSSPQRERDLEKERRTESIPPSRPMSFTEIYSDDGTSEPYGRMSWIPSNWTSSHRSRSRGGRTTTSASGSVSGRSRTTFSSTRTGKSKASKGVQRIPRTSPIEDMSEGSSIGSEMEGKTIHIGGPMRYAPDGTYLLPVSPTEARIRKYIW